MDVVRMELVGTPGLTLAILVLVGLSIYRFWVVGWAAWAGNLRFAALVAICLGLTVLCSGPLWIFGIRNRKVALIVIAVAGIAFLILNNF